MCVKYAQALHTYAAISDAYLPWSQGAARQTKEIYGLKRKIKNKHEPQASEKRPALIHRDEGWTNGRPRYRSERKSVA